ncbi:MAG: hypothetical protein WBG32_08010 [Nodosilinea sp.]
MPLAEFAAQLIERLELGTLLNALGDHLDIQVIAEANNSVYNAIPLGVLVNIGNEAAIDFKTIDGQLL